MRRLEANVFAAFGHKFIDAVAAADVRERMLAIERRNARDVAKRAHVTRLSVCDRSRHCKSESGRGLQAEGILGLARTENRARVDVRELPELLQRWATTTVTQSPGLH